MVHFNTVTCIDRKKTFYLHIYAINAFTTKVQSRHMEFKLFLPCVDMTLNHIPLKSTDICLVVLWKRLMNKNKWVLHMTKSLIKSQMGLDARKSVFGVCEQQRRRPACASAQSDQRICYSLIGKYHI